MPLEDREKERERRRYGIDRFNFFFFRLEFGRHRGISQQGGGEGMVGDGGSNSKDGGPTRRLPLHCMRERRKKER